MDDALAHMNGGGMTFIPLSVLILVVMDDALAQARKTIKKALDEES